MSSLNQNTKEWLEKDLIPKLKSLFSKSECRMKYKISVPENSQFMSTLFILDLKFTDVHGKCEKTISTIVKRPASDESLSEWLNFEAFFHNEILFYTKCAKIYKNCPELLYVENKPSGSAIVIENVSKQGYLLNSDKVNVSDKYMLAAVRELARFHAIGYDQKQKSPKEFFEIVKNIKGMKELHTTKMSQVISCGIPRVLKYLRKNNQADQVFCEKLERYFSDPYSNVIMELSKAVEPLATLCHGDFTVNNILYKEEEEIMKFKLIDFAMISYCSPFIDFSVFLLLSGTREQRRGKFQEIFCTYCEELLLCLEKYEVLDLERFSIKCLMEDYKRHAVFGYVVACFYRPILMGCCGSNNAHLENVSPDFYGSLGGDDVTKSLVDMLMDLKEVGCLDHIVN